MGVEEDLQLCLQLLRVQNLTAFVYSAKTKGAIINTQYMRTAITLWETVFIVKHTALFEIVQKQQSYANLDFIYCK